MAVGNFENMQAILVMFWPWLGKRRRARAIQAIQDGCKLRPSVKHKPRCIWGHKFTKKNTYIWKSFRFCRKCRKIRDRKRLKKEKI